MELTTVFCGGTEDSDNPRKVHLASDAGRPLCGQYIPHYERVEQGMVSLLDYTGFEACRKCAKKIHLRPNT